ncbi:hypothetical protein Q1695_001329 [Nippostrongylus brasiliensis]|nr:hypothetical protein Q1695_001329 [Nippostrongylus brasiliensis]
MVADARMARRRHRRKRSVIYDDRLFRKLVDLHHKNCMSFAYYIVRKRLTPKNLKIRPTLVSKRSHIRPRHHQMKFIAQVKAIHGIKLSHVLLIDINTMSWASEWYCERIEKLLPTAKNVAIPGRTIPKEPPPLKGPVPTGAKRQPIPPELRSIQIPKMPWDEPCSNDEPVYELIENPVPQPKSQLTLDEYLRARRINRQLREAMWNPNITTQQLLPVYLEAISFISARDRVI